MCLICTHKHKHARTHTHTPSNRWHLGIATVMQPTRHQHKFTFPPFMFAHYWKTSLYTVKGTVTFFFFLSYKRTGYFQSQQTFVVSYIHRCLDPCTKSVLISNSSFKMSLFYRLLKLVKTHLNHLKKGKFMKFVIFKNKKNLFPTFQFNGPGH